MVFCDCFVEFVFFLKLEDVSEDENEFDEC